MSVELVHEFTVPYALCRLVCEDGKYLGDVTVSLPRAIDSRCQAPNASGDWCEDECLPGTSYCASHQSWEHCQGTRILTRIHASSDGGWEPRTTYDPAMLGMCEMLGITPDDFKMTPRLAAAAAAQLNWMGEHLTDVFGGFVEALPSSARGLEIRVGGFASGATLSLHVARKATTRAGAPVDVAITADADPRVGDLHLPRWGTYLMLVLLPDEVLEENLGDFAERYAKKVAMMGTIGARIWFYRKVAESLRPYAAEIFGKLSKLGWIVAMLKWLFSGHLH